MEIINYLTGQGGFMLLALIAIFALLIKKYKNWRYFKQMDRYRKNNDSL